MLRRAKECKSLAWSVQIAPPKLCQLSFHSSVPSLSALSGALLEILKHLLEIVDDVMIVCYIFTSLSKLHNPKMFLITPIVSSYLQSDRTIINR